MTMTNKVKKEIEKIMKERDYSFSVEEFKDRANWATVCKYNVLSEDFIREFRDKINWDAPLLYRSLSETFMREFKDKMWWSYIIGYRDVSEDFIYDMKEEMGINCFNYCIKKGTISEEYIKKRGTKVDRFEIMDMEED
jgi:hypothetical protein